MRLSTGIDRRFVRSILPVPRVYGAIHHAHSVRFGTEASQEWTTGFASTIEVAQPDEFTRRGAASKLLQTARDQAVDSRVSFIEAASRFCDCHGCRTRYRNRRQHYRF